MEPYFFKKPAEFRKWLQKNHTREKELVVGFYKTGSGKPTMSWPESVDEALCFGWIDGVRTSLGDESYTIRFTPRKPGSTWSAVNIKKIENLVSKGLMKPAGLAAFEKRTAEKSAVYSFEKPEVKFSATYQEQFKTNKKAWEYFDKLAASYKKSSIHWVMSAKQEATQQKRLSQLIEESEAGVNQWKDNKYIKKVHGFN